MSFFLCGIVQTTYLLLLLQIYAANPDLIQEYNVYVVSAVFFFVFFVVHVLAVHVLFCLSGYVFISQMC